MDDNLLFLSLIKLELLGYGRFDKGICHGVAMASMVSCLNDSIDDSFSRYFQILLNLTDENIRSIKEGPLQQEITLGNGQTIWTLDFLAFLDRMLLFHAPSDCKGTNLLFLAAYTGDLVFVKELISRGADTNHLNCNGISLIGISAWMRHAAVVEALITCGASVNTPDYEGKTPLYYAVQSGYTDIVKTRGKNKSGGY